MATNKGGNTNFLYFVVGALVIVVAGFALHFFGAFEDKNEAEITIELPKVTAD